MKSEPEIPLTRVGAFIQQHTHELRNSVNNLDLEIAYFQMFATDPKARESGNRMREQTHGLEKQLRLLVKLFEEPCPEFVQLAARTLLLIWRDQATDLESAPEIEWADELGDDKVNVDVEIIAGVLQELLANATAFHDGDPVKIRAFRDGDEVAFELREPKSKAVDTTGWGQPFFTTRRNGYGLGLWAAKRRAEASGAKFAQYYSSEQGALLTRVALPIA